MARVVLDLIDQVEPTLRELVAALEAAQAAKGKPAAQMLAAMANLQTAVQELTDQAVDQADMFSGKVSRARRSIVRASQKAKGKRKRAARA